MRNKITLNHPIMSIRLFFCLLLVTLFSCNSAPETGTQDFKVPFEQFTLPNGLQVIFHIDRSDPVVAVTLTSHVGSAREKAGRTGFAHLFEHLLFLESENLGKGGLDKMSARIGGSGANGSTSRDRTNYFQTVPNDALEKMIWAEADKLGWFINTVTDPVLAKEKQVVKNEKRQGVDNQPYGHTSYVIDKNLYPADHPYNWEVIGSLEDLDNATLQDVKDFYRRWYVPNNVTLVISGDFDTAQARQWVEKYFGEIKRGEDVPPLEKKPAVLSETKKLYHEDNFARLPELTMAWPGVPQYHPDSYPLEVLANYLSQGKKAPFNQVIVDEKQLAARVDMYHDGSELAGEYFLSIRAYEGKDLDEVMAAVNEAFARFEKDGISDDDLERIKAGQETAFYNGLSSVLGKGFQLAQYQIFAGDPGFINQDVKNILAVTKEDVRRVYDQYIKGKHFVATSFVPKGQLPLALEGSVKADVVEEPIVEGAEEEFDLSQEVAYERTPSSFDRTVEPPYGKAPEITVPNVWEQALPSGLRVYGIENNEVPLVQVSMVIRGGLLLEQPDKTGVSNLLAEMMTKGTQTKTTAQLEEAIEKLGAAISVNAGEEDITVRVSTLARNYGKVIALVQEILLEPRWDEKEFELARQSAVSDIQQQASNPNSIAANEYRRLIYGAGNILSNNPSGTEASVNSITLDDLKKYFDANISPTVTTIHVVGDIRREDVVSSLSALDANWPAKPVTIPEVVVPAAPEHSVVYFYNVPGAKQSVLRFGYPALAATDADFYPATVMNYRLGGGGFASQLTQQLREGKGYTYGINSRFEGSAIRGPFTISSGVRSNVTYESAALVKEILENYGKDFNENDLEVTQSFLIKSQARSFETPAAKRGMLENISAFGWPYDYARQRETVVRDMTLDRIRELAGQYLDPNRMYYLVVGDAATQMEKLNKLGFGKVVLINELAN